MTEDQQDNSMPSLGTTLQNAWAPHRLGGVFGRVLHHGVPAVALSK
jgi:hypothetical protein